MTEKNTFAIDELQQKANSGDAQAQFGLALFYVVGGYIEKDFDLAFEWHKKAAEQGFLSAQYLLGLYYLFYLFAEGDYSKEEWCAITSLSKYSQFFDYYGVESGFYSNYLLDLVGARVFSKRKTINSSGNTALWFKNPGDLAVLWLKKAAEQHHSYANFWLALCYRDGIGTQQNDELMFNCFKKAAELGNASAYYGLALCYRDGRGCQQNDELTIQWITKAEAQEKLDFEDFFKPDIFKSIDETPEFKFRPYNSRRIAEAFFFIGKRYAEGKGVDQNDELAFHWYERAAEWEVAEAQFCLAHCYEFGIGVEINIPMALEWYKAAAEKGICDAEVEYRLAKFYLFGNGVEKNYNKGMYWLMKAARDNHPGANQWLENTYLNFVFPYFSEKEKVDQFHEFAFKWLLSGFEQKPQDCEINFGLAVLYAFGKGVQKNQELALKYFKACMDECSEVNDGSGPVDLMEILYQFSDLYQCISKVTETSYFFDLAPIFLEEAPTAPGINKSYAVLPSLRINFHLERGEFELLKEFLNSFENLESSFHYPSSKESFKSMSLIAMDQAETLEEINKELVEKNKNLLEAEKELEDMMSMFAHKFRSPLDAIIYNTTHENQVKLYTEAAQTMRGLLNIFSIISTDAEILKDKIKQDRIGSGRLATVFSRTLDMILLHLLSVSGAEKIQQHYMAYATKHGRCDEQVSYKGWCEDYFELEQILQAEWEQSFAELLNQSATLEQRLAWLEQHFFRLEMIGFEREDIQFKEYGVTESLLTILINEILVNAFKYYSSASKQPVVLEWKEREGYQVLICRNPSNRSERSIIKGSNKGHVFLSTLARKTGSAFTKPMRQDDFVVEFGIPDELLISKSR
jgi:TPR repeat protein/signal transduction histidine kinase